MLFTDAFADFLVESGAENYVEVSFTSEKRPEIGQIVVTVQRLSGKTPHALRRDAELENERLREDAERLDSGLIRLVDRDEFGESVATVYSQVDLRAAIDAARAAEKGKE